MMPWKQKVLMKILLEDSYLSSSSTQWQCWLARSQKKQTIGVICNNMSEQEHVFLEEVLQSCQFMLENPSTASVCTDDSLTMLLFNHLGPLSTFSDNGKIIIKRGNWLELPGLKILMSSGHMKRQLWAVIKEYVLH